MGIGVKFSNMGSKIDVKIKDEDSCAKVDSSSAVYIRGEDGEDGAIFYPEISEDGTLSWTNDKELENPEPVNIKGPPGEQGIQGSQGPAGKDGYTPIKGEDYFTKEEVADIARAASDLIEIPETAKDAVLYIKQELTDEQKAQARANIGANSLPIATDDEILEMIVEIDMLPAVADQDGALLSDENGNILLW